MFACSYFLGIVAPYFAVHNVEEREKLCGSGAFTERKNVIYSIHIKVVFITKMHTCGIYFEVHIEFKMRHRQRDIGIEANYLNHFMRFSYIAHSYYRHRQNNFN